jgi:hypothetical protein
MTAFSTSGCRRKDGTSYVRSRVDVQIVSEPVLETHVLEVEVIARELHFLLQCRTLAPGMEARPKQLTQRHHHLPGLRHVGLHHGRDPVQRVEEEVGLHLRP